MLDACINGMSKSDLKGRLEAAVGQVIAGTEHFRLAAQMSTCHTLDPADFNVPGVSGSEMKSVYKRLVDPARPTRAIYDAIKSAPAHGRCPLCGHGTVHTLDHHLPQSRFPALVVAPLNLVPACRDCNSTKLAFSPSTPDDEPLHPYFDDVDDEHWLAAEVVHEVPAAIRFHVGDCGSWSPTRRARMQAHFTRFDLGKLYGQLAAGAMADISSLLGNQWDAGGSDAVSELLSELAASAAANICNSWRAVMYDALAASEWYCNGGFRNPATTCAISP